MESLAEYIRRIGADVDLEYKIAKIKIFFKAEVGQSLTVEEDTTEEKNFQWVQYSIIFSKGDQYYLFRSPISPDGTELLGGDVFESDSSGEDLKKATLTKNEVITAFPGILKGSPELIYKDIKRKTGLRKEDVTYYNQVGAGVKDYSVEEFERTFFKDFYVVFSEKKEKKRPDGKPVKYEHPEETPASEEGIK
jgi:hypothetical protein